MESNLDQAKVEVTTSDGITREFVFNIMHHEVTDVKVDGVRYEPKEG